MSQKKPFFARYSLLILMAFAFATPLLLQGAQKAVKSNTNKVQDWLPNDFTETTELRWFRQHFVADQFVLISWDGCTLGDNPELPDGKPDDPRIERLAKFLLGPNAEVKPKHGEPAGYKGMFQAVTTARRLLDDLTSKPSEIPYAEAHKRLENVLIGPDGRQTCLVVMLSDAAIKNFREVLGRSVADGKLPWKRKPGILWEALDQCGISKDSVHLGGPPVENVAIDEEGGRTIARLGAISGVLGIALAWWSLRSIRLTAIVFGCGVLSAAAGLSAVYWSGHTMDAVLMSMPSLLYVLAISGSVHLVNYYKESLRQHGLEGAPEEALKLGWKPALLCSITTAIGLGSLYVSDIAPIAKFGLFSAIGVMLMLVMLFLLLPAALQMWPARSWLPKVGDAHDHRHFDAHAGTIWSEEVWHAVSTFLIRNHVAVSIGCFAVIAIVGFGVTKMHTSIDLLKLFDQQANVRQDYRWLEDNVARLVPMEVVVRFPNDMLRDDKVDVEIEEIPETLSFLERMETVAWIQESIEREIGPQGRDLVGPAMAAATFAPPLPEGRDVFAVGRRTTTNAQLEASHKNLTKSGYLAIDESDGAELWRVSLRAAAFRDLDYGLFVESVREIVEPVLAAQRLRQLVLRNLAAEHPGESFAGDTVCIWDPRGAGSSDAQATDEANIANGSVINSQKIFADSWKRFLQNARLKLQYASYDLSKLDDNQRERLFTALKKFDSVVLAGPFNDQQIEQLKNAGIHVVDARKVSGGRESFIVQRERPNADTVSAVYTGVVPIVYKAQRTLLENLMQSTFWSFVTITPLLMFVTRSVLGGAVAMLPNVLPVLVIFGAMGWLGINIDIGSMMSASIALGVAVDDTIHYLTWYRKDLGRLRDRRAAIRTAYRHCGPPTVQAALISGLSLSVFVLSTFTPTQRMGWLMLSILMAGMVAELIMLPALLAGPLGKSFPIPPQKGKRGEEDRPPHEDEAPRDNTPPSRDHERRQVRKKAIQAVADNGDAELSSTPHRPHAFTLRERLAAIRRGVRDNGIQ